MLIGDPASVAIEYEIVEIPEGRPLGWFLVHIDGHSFGRRRPDATMLRASVDAVRKRLEDRGQHQWPDFAPLSGLTIANAYLKAIYSSDAVEKGQLETAPYWKRVVSEADPVWAPDGDEAFDDGTHILQFDIANYVRLLAFKNTGHELATENLVDFPMPSNDFYDLLEAFVTHFEHQLWQVSKRH